MTAERCRILAETLADSLAGNHGLTDEEAKMNMDIVASLREYARVLDGKTIDADAYQRKARSFAQGGGSSLVYALFGMLEELGELVEKIQFDKMVEGSPKYDVESSDVSMAGMIAAIQMMTEPVKKIAKHIRKNWDSLLPEQRESITSFSLKDGWEGEVGDIMWFAAAIASCLNVKMSSAMGGNIAKLSSRKDKGIIIGEGDTDAERLRNAGRN